MIKTEYRRDMGKNYLIFQSGTELEEGYFLKLVQNGSIDGILPLEIRTVDGKKECYCDVTGKQSLRTALERGGIDKEQLEEILKGIQAIIKKGEAYLLQLEDYVLSVETIFLGLLDFSIYLCYLPGYKVSMEDKWKDFTQYLMNTVDYKKEDTVLYVYNLYKAARQPGGFTEELWRKEKGEKEAAEEKQEEGFEGQRQIQAFVPEFEERIEEDEQVEAYPGKIYMAGAVTIAAAIAAAVIGLFIWRPGRVQAGAYLLVLGALCAYVLGRLFSGENKEARIERQVEFIPAEEEKWGTEASVKSDGVYKWQSQEEENTVILAAEVLKKNGFLRAEDNRRYQDIELIEFPFFFGKLRTQVNSSIESPAVSRCHAKIEHLGGEYYLADLNSTNGTYLNGERLKAYERRKLMPMDRVQFADVGYYFEMDLPENGEKI